MLNKPQLLFTRTKPVTWKCDVCEELFLLSSEKLTLQEKAWDLERRFEDHVRANHPSENREFTTKINSPEPGHARNETPIISQGSGIAERNAARLQQVLSIAYEIDNLDRLWDLERRFEDHVRANHPSENREFTTKINSPEPGHARNETPIISQGSGIAERNAARLQQILSIAYEIDNLDRLRKSGSITQDEFVRLRAKLVA